MPSPNPTTPPLSDSRRALGLHRTATDCAELLARATKARWSPAQVLEELVRAESQDRARRSLERRLTRARLGAFKPMADFEWDWPKTIDRAAVERVLTLDFLDRAENVILAAGQGRGKTMLAKNVAYQAVLPGASVRFVTAADLLLDLGARRPVGRSSAGSGCTSSPGSSPSTSSAT
jgi:DNA replication protein DnaC